MKALRLCYAFCSLRCSTYGSLHPFLAMSMHKEVAVTVALVAGTAVMAALASMLAQVLVPCAAMLLALVAAALAGSNRSHGCMSTS